MPYFIILVLSLFISSLGAIDVDENSSSLSLLESAFILVDSQNNLTKTEVIAREFEVNKGNIVSLGYRADIALWIKFTLHNSTSQSLYKILEYDNPETEELFLYDDNESFSAGLLHLGTQERSINPTFDINLKPYQTKTFYLKTSSRMKPIKAKLLLWEEKAFLKKELEHQIYYLIFFSVLLTLFIYNFMLFLFTLDKAYFYYILYLLSIIFFNALFSGILSLYFPSYWLNNLLLKLNEGVVVLVFLFALLFAQSFLDTKEFPRLDKILNIILISLPLFGILGYNNWIINANSFTLLLLMALFVVYVGFYALFKGQKQAKFYVLGWTIILIAFMLLGLEAIFHYDIRNYHLTYAPEIGFVLEALLFSIALAHRIKLGDETLLQFQKEEQIRLEALVKEKTKALSISLDEKEILYKELNHRIKNNFMMILSLLKLQIKRTSNTQTIDSLRVTQNRIKSISRLYEMLLLNDKSVRVNTNVYIRGICQNISINFASDVDIYYDIDYTIDNDSLVYVGLVVNELVTNSFKYAFGQSRGEIRIFLVKKGDEIILGVQDNGKGFTTKRSNSLGLTIVDILVEGQLQGSFTLDATEGTKALMKWKA